MSASPPVRVGDDLRVEIVDLAFGGRGVARSSGFVVFVKGALPGERARVRVRRVHPGFAEADCLAILEPSSDRVTPPCRHFGECGGCDLQHLSHRAQADAKRLQIEALLKRVANLDAPPVRAAAPVGDPTQYRFRMDFDWGTGPDGRPILGLHRAGRAGSILPIQVCHLMPDPANRIRDLFGRGVAEKGLTAWDARRRKGLMRRLSIQMARVTGEILITLETGRGDPPALRELAGAGARAFPRIVGIVRREFDRNDRLAGESILHGRDHLFEEVDGDRFKIPAGAFFQPNATAWSALREVVTDELEPGAEDTILELYCGVGFFTLPLARRCRRIVALDSSREAAAAARDNAARAGIANARFVCGDAADGLPELLKVKRLDAILLDPPRTGLPRAVARTLSRAAARRMVYVACDPATLARDLKVLTGEGPWRLRSVSPLDLFPLTHHTECVVRLDREGT
ncbi:MAG TPA: 23S rRNA (uracil(1939)-C(5))-methyltransferase RlmD [Candidatus Polarisedimenticolia bacterium]|nr:23S rRNA (uracil(1939)-C(5))-methyltransferase RlmD [Candidatus Polarisedimenticolia bacterium]